MEKEKNRRLSVTFVNNDDVVEHISELVAATPIPEIKPEEYGFTVGSDLCLPETTVKQDATWLDKKPSAEQLAVASQTAVAVAGSAQELAVPPGPLPIQLTLQNNTGGTIPPVAIKNEPLSDMEEPTVSTAIPQNEGEEVSVSHMKESGPSIIVPQPCLQDSKSDWQGNAHTISGSSLPPEVQILRPNWEENILCTDLLHPSGQATTQQSQENVQIIDRGQHSRLENALLKKILAKHRKMSPLSTPKQIQIKKTDKGIVAMVLVPKETRKPAIGMIRMPTKKIERVLKSRPSKQKPKRKKRKSKRRTEVIPEAKDNAQEGWEEVKKDDEVVLRKEAKRDADENELNKEDEFLRAADTLEEFEQSMLHNDDCFSRGFDSEVKEDKLVQEIEDDDGKYEEDEEDLNEVGVDDPNDSDYDPYQNIQKKQPRKRVAEHKVSSLECSVRSFNSHKKSKQKKKREPTNYFLLSTAERRKHILMLQLAKTRRVRLDCKLCRDSFFTVQNFQLHFKKKHPGEAEKLATDVQVTLERKRIAFGKMEGRKKRKMKKKKRDAQNRKFAQKKKAAEEKKMWLEKLAEYESQPRRSTRLARKKAKRAFELLGWKCGNSGNKSHLLETQSSTTELEMDSNLADVPSDDQSNLQDAQNVSRKVSDLQMEEDNDSKAPTVEEPEPQRDKKSEDTNTNTDITMQEMNAERRVKEKEGNDNPANATIHETEPQSGNLNKNTENPAISTILETDAQMNKENEGNRDSFRQEKNALVVDESENSFCFPKRKLHQSDEPKNKTYNEPHPLKSNLWGSCISAARTDNKVETGDTTAEKEGILQSSTNLESAWDASKHTIHKPENSQNGGTLDCREIKQSDLLENMCNQDLQLEDSEQAINPEINETQKNVHKYEVGDENTRSTSKDATNPYRTIDIHVGELKARDQASMDGRSSTNLSEPMNNEETRVNGVLPVVNNSEVVRDNSEPEEVEFVPEVDADVIFELDAWSNILLECMKCSGFIEFWRFTSHLNDHDKRKKACRVCGKFYSNSTHVQRCLGIKQCGVCEICGKCVSNVKLHVRQHQKHEFTCKICSATFLCNSRLNRHMQVHSSVKEHVCEICGRSFSQAGNLKGHMRQHTKEKPYKCDMCEKSFVHNVSLKTHKKRDHGIDPWLGANTTTMGRRKKERDDASNNTAK